MTKLVDVAALDAAAAGCVGSSPMSGTNTYGVSMKLCVVDNVGTLTVSERFTFQLHRDFRQLSTETKALTTVLVDFINCKYIDSSALGMLLMLKDCTREVVLINAKDDVSKVLEIANFSKLFRIRKN